MDATIRSNKGEKTNTALMNYKDDERLLSESLYRNLHVIQRFHEPTADFTEVFEPHMFLKSNPKAFFHVVHFLFISLDAAEFHKRFVWPVYDRDTGTRFRKSTVDYFNHLNIIHQLGFETFKLSNIHIPGGFKFIKIIHKFSHLIMQQEIKRWQHKSLPNLNEIPDANEQLAKFEEVFNERMDYISRLETQSDILTERMDNMKTMMSSLILELSAKYASQKVPCLSCLIKLWRDDLDNIVENEIKPQLERIILFSRKSVELQLLLTKLFADRKDNVIQYDENKWITAQNVLKKWNPDLEPAIDGIATNNFIHFDQLFKVYSFVLPKIMEQIAKFEFRGLKAIQFEYNEIDKLDTKASQLQSQMNDIEKKLEPFLNKEKERFLKFCEEVPNLPFNIMQTPVVNRRYEQNRFRNRLNLIDISNTKLFREPLLRSTFNKTNLSNTKIFTGQCSSQQLNATGQGSSGALAVLSKTKFRANRNQTFSNNLSTFSKSPVLSSTMLSTPLPGNRNGHQTELKFSAMFSNLNPTHVISKNVVETSAMSSPCAITVTRRVSTNSVYHFSSPNRSPSGRFELTSGLANIPAKLVRSIVANNQSNGGNHDRSNTTTIETIIENMNGNIDSNDYIGNISDTLLDDVSLTD